MTLAVAPYTVEFVAGSYVDVFPEGPLPVDTLPELRNLAEHLAESLNALPIDLGTGQIGLPGPAPTIPGDMHLGVLLLGPDYGLPAWLAGPYFMVFPDQSMLWAVAATAVPTLSAGWLLSCGLALCLGFAFGWRREAA